MLAKTSSEVEKHLTQNAYLEFCREWASDFAPRLKRKPSVWAQEVRIIAAGTSPMTHGQDIKYDHAIMPHCVDQMDTADDPHIRKIVLWAPIRDGKTLSVCANIIGRTVTDSPGNIYSVHPTDENAEAFSNTDIEPMIEACLQGYFVEKKSRDTGRTIEMKKFKGGWIRIFSANSLAKFHGTSVEVLLLHELDKLNPEAIFKAFGRTTGFANAIIVMESTGTLCAEIDPESGKKIYRSNIEEAYDQGDKRKWFCPCRECGYLQTLRYEQIRNPIGRMDLARYHCAACDHPHTPSEWKKLAASGRWYPTAGLTDSQIHDIARNYHHARALEPSVRSYWRNGFSNLLPHSKGYKSKLHQFKAEGEAAQRSPIAKMIWTQEVKAELWNPDTEVTDPPAYQPIIDNREGYANEAGDKVLVPEEAVVLTTMTDPHGDRLEVEWRAWSKTEESWGVGHFVLFGNTAQPDVWKDWTDHLQKKFPHALGGEIGMSLGLVDGGWAADRILPTIRRLKMEHVPGVSGKIIMSKGVPQWQAVIYRQWATINDRAKGIHVGTWCAKSLLYERLRWHSTPSEKRPSAGFVHFGKCYTEEFIRQCVSEKSVMKIINAKEIETFKNPEGNRNEGIDLIVGNLAAFRRRKWDFDTMAKELTVKATSEPPNEEPKIEPRRTEFGARRGWNL